MSIFTKKKKPEELAKPIYVALTDEEYDALRYASSKITPGEPLSGEDYWKTARNIFISRGISLDPNKQHELHISLLAHSVRLSEKTF